MRLNALSWRELVVPVVSIENSKLRKNKTALWEDRRANPASIEKYREIGVENAACDHTWEAMLSDFFESRSRDHEIYSVYSTRGRFRARPSPLFIAPRPYLLMTAY